MSSVARRHAEWLSLLEINGPFLSMAVLLKAFPQGLDAHDTDHSQLLRIYYEEWLENQESPRADPAIHRAWIDFVLKETLGLADEVLFSGQRIPETLSAHIKVENETLRPDLVLVNPAGSAGAGAPRLLIQILPSSQGVEKSMENHRWKASPASRMLEVLKATKTRIGLVTNGEQWMLVNAPQGESTGYITWTADLWVDETTTLQAFRSLLSLRRFFGVDDSQTIEALLNDSLADQQEVTDQLGYQVRKAVEVLIQAFDRMDQDHNRELLRGVSPTFLYEAALTVMMRLVFLLSAEERGLFMLGEEMYDQHYAVSTLRAQLRETADQQGEEVLSTRSDAWCRLLATFRTVYGGVEHDALSFPAYGGNLFDPDRFTFLEGRSNGTHWRETPANPIPINNQIVLHLLEALQILRVKVPGGPPEPRRLSFSALGVEQIGHVYEGLLDHTAVRATSPVLGLAGSKDQECEVRLDELERLKERGEKDLLEHLKKFTGRQAITLKRALDAGANEKRLDDREESERMVQACNNDAALSERVRPWAKLLRGDTMDFPVVINIGSLYVTSGDDRRSTGTHYTPPTLTEPIVKHTLDPLVYAGPAEGLPEAEWKLKSAKEILDLKVCDMAMGSGAFLVQACRYLAEKLVAAWGDIETNNPGAFIITPEGAFSTGSIEERFLPVDVDERILIARRYVADRCLYGVDINPMAVEMAKLSLWLITLHRDRPFTFLDHAFKCGDSLLGVSSMQQIENFSLRAGEQQLTFATANLFRYVEDASTKRRALEDLPSNDYTQIEIKNHLHLEAEAATSKVKAVADALIALELRGLSGDAYEEERTVEAEKLQALMKRDADASMRTKPTTTQLSAYASKQLSDRRTFHWAVEFPEVHGRGGFDAFVGNPPFMGGKKITGNLGKDYRELLVSQIANGAKGNADLSAYFLLRCGTLVSSTGVFGLITTNTIAQGDTREVALDHLHERGLFVVRTIPSGCWPGTASVFYSAVWATRQQWRGEFVIGDVPVAGITPYLTAVGQVVGSPQRLAANRKKAFLGSMVLGTGFILDTTEAAELLRRNSMNRMVIHPYLTGQDLNSSSKQYASRRIINFYDWPLCRNDAPFDYQGHTCDEFPECLQIVVQRVKSERERLAQKKDASAQAYASKWWQYGRRAQDLYTHLGSKGHVLAVSLINNHLSFCFVPDTWVYAHKLALFPFADWHVFSVIQSTFHYVWAWQYCSTNLSLLNYSPTDAFESFPFPTTQSDLATLGKEYHEFRSNLMVCNDEGLTATYNRVHDVNEKGQGIAHLRASHVQMDHVVAAAYGWTDIDLGHGFHETKQGVRFTISEPARREVLDRLLHLNHERYAEEVRLGLHDKKGGKKRSASRAQKAEISEGLFT
jgi:hypothetical protein